MDKVSQEKISGHSYGHLENQPADELWDGITGNTQRVVLAHLSEENNTPEIALSTVLRILKELNISKNPNVQVQVAPHTT